MLRGAERVCWTKWSVAERGDCKRRGRGLGRRNISIKYYCKIKNNITNSLYFYAQRERERGVKLCKFLVIVFLLIFLLSFLIYFITFFIRTSDRCSSTWPHDYNKKHCIHRTTKILYKLEKVNPILHLINKHYLFKIDLLPQKQVNEAYELMAFVDYVLTKHNIPYTVDGGTEMGSIRNGGFIQWDDDLDIAVLDKPQKVQKAFEEEIKKNNLGERFVYKNLSKDVKSRHDTIRIVNGIVLDILYLDDCIILKGGKKIFVYTRHHQCEYLPSWAKLYYEQSNIFPIRECPFGPLTVKCKNNIVEPYNRYYGDDWMDVAYTGNHTFNHKRSKKINLREHKELLKPALPNDDAWKKWVDKKYAIKK